MIAEGRGCLICLKTNSFVPRLGHPVEPRNSKTYPSSIKIAELILQQVELDRQQGELDKNRKATLAIGSVQQSFLTLDQFQAQMGDDWVLCDGSSVAGTKYESLGLGSIVPDCTGRFLKSNHSSRTGAGNPSLVAELKSTQSFSKSMQSVSLSHNLSGLFNKSSFNHYHGAYSKVVEITTTL